MNGTGLIILDWFGCSYKNLPILEKAGYLKKTLHFPESFGTRLKFSSDTLKRLLEGASFFIIPSSNTCFSIRKLLSASIEYQSDHAIKI